MNTIKDDNIRSDHRHGEGWDATGSPVQDEHPADALNRDNEYLAGAEPVIEEPAKRKGRGRSKQTIAELLEADDKGYQRGYALASAGMQDAVAQARADGINEGIDLGRKDAKVDRTANMLGLVIIASITFAVGVIIGKWVL